MYHKQQIRDAAARRGFELCGIAAATPTPDAELYKRWTAAGFAGEMRYLTDHRAGVREDPRALLPTARSIICLGKVYNWPAPYSTAFSDETRAWISRYAWGDDYHEVMRGSMKGMVEELGQEVEADWRICVDTAPLLERSYARLAGLGWIGRNTCLINQQLGSWVFLGEILTSLEIEPDGPPPDRCGTCRRCIEACPTEAIVPFGGGFTIDSRLCISYLTIELRGDIADELRGGMGAHVFGCDICQDVCPWNRRAAVTGDVHFAPRHRGPELSQLAQLTEEEFRGMFRGTPVSRARYSGFLRSVAVAMGNSGDLCLVPALEKLARSDDPVVARHASWGLEQLSSGERRSQ
ncbi:MAG TPA: tRNA epoxyqueuosine(34) reductase QueG [Bryobacteraceae bacterium]